MLDSLGRRHQFLPPEISPLRDDMVVAGRAMPVLQAGVGANRPGRTTAAIRSA